VSPHMEFYFFPIFSWHWFLLPFLSVFPFSYPPAVFSYTYLPTKMYKNNRYGHSYSKIICKGARTMKSENLSKNDDPYRVEATSANDLDGSAATELTGMIPFLPE